MTSRPPSGKLHQQQANRPLTHHQHRLPRGPCHATALRQVFTGSTKAASSGRTPSGMGMAPRSTIQSSARTNSASPRPMARSRPSCRCACRNRTGRKPGARSRSSARTERGGARRRAGHRDSTASPNHRLVPRRRRSRGRRSAGRGQPLLDLLEVRSADSAGVDPHEHLPRRGLGDRDLFDGDLAGAPVNDGRTEKVPAARRARSLSVPSGGGRSRGSSGCRRGRRCARSSRRGRALPSGSGAGRRASGTRSGRRGSSPSRGRCVSWMSSSSWVAIAG